MLNRTAIVMEKADLEDRSPSCSSSRLHVLPLPPPEMEHPSTQGKRETFPTRTRTRHKDNRTNGLTRLMDLRTSPLRLHPFGRSSPAKLQSEAPRRVAVDQHPSIIGHLIFGAKNPTLKINNSQYNSQSTCNMTLPRDKTAEQTSRVASWIRSGQGSLFPSPTSTSSSSSTVASRTYTPTSVLPLHLLKIPKSAKAVALPRRPTLATAPIYRPPANPPEPRSMTRAASDSSSASFSRKPVVIDLTLDDTPVASEASDTGIPSPTSPTLRSCSPSFSQTAATTSATTMSPSPRTSAAPAESLHEDLAATDALQVPPSTSTPQLARKRERPFERRRRKESDSIFTASSRLNMQATTKSSTGYTSNLSEQEQNDNEPKLKEEVVKGNVNTLVPEDNNDYCESCRGTGRFICCESCPSVFHFSCCQPPVDPENLPDEWHCTECRDKTNPPKPYPPGLFQLLLDNINRSNPGVFELPQEILSYFRGVETKSDGGYADTVDYKPCEPVTTNQSAWEKALELEDKKGEIRLCYHCGRSALRKRWLISCEHCPLHWHLDCLSPPLSSPPSRTRKWMCPNHAYHVQPQYRKRRNASPIEVLDPLVPNDGDIEVVDEKQGNNNNNNNNNSQSPEAPEYRLSESNIRFDFIATCSRSRNSSRPTPPRTEPVIGEGQGDFDALEMLAQTAILVSSGELGGRLEEGGNKR